MFIKRFYVICAEEDGGEGSTGGAAPTVEEQIATAVKAATDGLALKNKDLLKELKDSRVELKRFEGIDPEKVKKIMDKFDTDEEAALLEKGNIEDIITKRYAKRDAEWQRKFDELKTNSDAKEAKVTKFMDRVLDDSLRTAFNGTVDPRSMKAALLEAKQIFKVDDEGNPVQLDEHGQVVLGKDGKSPFSPSEWITSDSIRKESPYLFPASGNGSGATQTNNALNRINGDFKTMSPTEKMNAGRKT